MALLRQDAVDLRILRTEARERHVVLKPHPLHKVVDVYILALGMAWTFLAVMG
jgi:hypothetical protein